MHRPRHISRSVFLTGAIALAFAHGGHVQGNERHHLFHIVATDAATGRAIPSVQYSLLRSEGGRAYARDVRTPYRGTELVRPGDVALVFARGYDLGKATVADPARPLSVPLTRAVESASIQAEAPTHVQRRIRLYVKHSVRSGSDARTLVVLHEYELPFSPQGTKLTLPQGMQTSAWPRGGPDDSLYPLVIAPRAGEEIVVRTEPLRDIALIADRTFEPAKGIVLPTYRRPQGWSPDRIDALIMRMGSALPIVRTGSGFAIKSVPNVDFHLFAALQSGPAYAFVPAGSESVRLVDRTPRDLTKSVLVSGAAVDRGSWIIAGRVSINAFAQLRRWHALGLATPVGEPRARVPVAPSYTIWSPRRGIAYGAWKDGAIVAARWERGAVVVRLASAGRFSGALSMWQTMSRPGGVMSGFLEQFWRREGKGARAVRIPGLPPGRYRLNVDLTVDATGTKVRHVNSLECPYFEITRQRPVAHVTLRD